MAENETRRDVERWVAEGYGLRPVAEPAEREQLNRRLVSEPPPRRRPGGLAWLIRPQSMSWSPLGAAVAAVLLLAGGFVVGRSAWSPERSALPSRDLAESPTASSPEELVQFVLVDRAAARVALVGDFNGWDADATPMRRDRDGAWSVALAIPSGRHIYAFIVDGRRWVADPIAPLAPEDGFGSRNSVVVVGEPGSI